MTPRRLAVLQRAADMSHLPGTALLYECEQKTMPQVRWLLENGYIKNRAGRLVATGKGKLTVELHNRRVALLDLPRSHHREISA